MLFDLHHCAYLCTCTITMYLLLMCSCAKYCALQILFFGCLLYSSPLLSYLLIAIPSAKALKILLSCCCCCCCCAKMSLQILQLLFRDRTRIAWEAVIPI